ncbi:MAG: ATP synthase F1 subunit gamma [Bacteroidales bacterium]
MANLKEIRTRIESVSSTKQITNAMKMVSAARLRKAQDAIIQMRPYALKLHDILFHLQMCMPNKETPYYSHREIKRVLIVVIGSNRGLCGAFNINVAKKAISLATKNYRALFDRNKVDFFCIGKKAEDYMMANGYNITLTRNDLLDELSFENAIPFIQSLLDSFTNGSYDKIEIIYNQFRNAAIQIITHETFLPLILPQEFCTPKEMEIAKHSYIIEPSKDFLVGRLMPKVLKTEFYKALLDSSASEYGARMTSMHKATDNADQLIRELRMQYNKARQSNITNEIIEIVGGAEALNK